MATILAQIGLRAVGPDGEAATLVSGPPLDEWYLWPENVPAWQLWMQVQTQWRVGGMGGATGLDHTAVWADLDHFGIPKRRRREVFGYLCAMERVVLDVWAEQAAERRQHHQPDTASRRL
jgi:hypothetical protein